MLDIIYIIDKHIKYFLLTDLSNVVLDKTNDKQHEQSSQERICKLNDKKRQLHRC